MIAGEEWKIIFKSKRKMPKNTMGEAQLSGENEIWILSGMTELQTRITIWHELFHVFFHNSGQAGKMTTKEEEAQCDAQGKYIAHIIYENKEFFK